MNQVPGAELDFLKRSAVKSEAQSATLWIILGLGTFGALLSVIIHALTKPAGDKFFNAKFEEKIVVGGGAGIAFGLLVAIIVYTVRASKLMKIESTHGVNLQGSFESELTKRTRVAELQQQQQQFQ